MYQQLSNETRKNGHQWNEVEDESKQFVKIVILIIKIDYARSPQTYY